ncbi:FecCD family ABC transporter permease [Spirillospora albida]|uniref:FecCD family ABC transporter permease n=1 Tax=Spirillospora albida TaxID=58123 RepID=UPI0004C1D2E9|nr:iron chelate uptake ABC transporter family permease subunit [Spirillospora albida]
MTRALLPLLAVLAAFLHVSAGGGEPGDLLAFAGGGPATLDERILWELGLPRLVTAALAGAALGVAGHLLQTSLRNPLAAPELTAVNPGAILGVLAAAAFGPVPLDSALGGLGAALVGGVLGGAVTWLLAAGGGPGRTVTAGLLGSALMGGLVTLLLAYQPGRFGNALRWLIGSVDGRVWDHLVIAVWWIPLWICVAWAATPVTTILQGGDQHAASLGLAPRRARLLVLGIAVALTACAASLAGALAFIGLVVPHAARRLTDGRPDRHVPAAALLGAAVLVGADAAAQALTRLIAGTELGHRLGLPAGVITALAGAAILIAIVSREKNP